MVNISYIIVIVVSIVALLWFASFRFIRHRAWRILGTILLILIIIALMFFRGLFIAGHSNPHTLYTVDGITYSYNPEYSTSYLDIGEFIKIEEIGTVYLSGFDRQNGQMRLFVRLLGTSGNNITELDMNLVDEDGNVYFKSGGFFDGAILISSASLDFIRDDGSQDVGTVFELIIAGKTIDIR